MAPEVNEGIEDVAVPVDSTEQDVSEQPEVAEGQASVEPFLELDLDGDKLSFSSKDEALKHLREGTLRHSDYTRKTQEVAEQRKQVEAKEQELEKQLNSFMEMKSQYDKIDGFMKQRPDVRDYILKQMRQPDPRRQMDSFREYTDERAKTLEEEIKSLKEKYEADTQAQQYEQQRKEVFSELGKQYEDFSPEQVTKMLSDIESYQSLPAKEAMRNFAEILYFANKGRQSPVEREEKVARSVTKPMPANTKPIEGKNKLEGDMDEIAVKLKKELGV